MECKFLSYLLKIFCAKRINRYIMECKLVSALDEEFVFPELIDTLWNVNALLHLPNRPLHPGINRYIMECK